ncbi:YwqH-like family protein [Bacillus coahuilensis]|uniref:YwqH-like family protein n=1 Tax=Bacillus coahuilensis TaxID=408580 RepID=UPI000AEE089C|nr:DUF5082 family protein [Bacillus coahuilensis]
MSYLSYLVSKQYEKREQLLRLNVAQSSLDALQGEFLQSQSTLKNPELTQRTWHGDRARRFEEARDDLLYSYKDISYTQLDQALTTIEQKASSLQAEIQSLETHIFNERERLERERREEV